MGKKEDESLLSLINSAACITYKWRIDGLIQLQDLASQAEDIEQLKSLRSILVSSMISFKDTIPEADRVRERAKSVENFISNRLYKVMENKKKLKGLKTIHSEQKIKKYLPAMRGKYLHVSTSEKQFLAMFQENYLPVDWEKIKWIGSRKDCISFMLDMCGEEIKPNVINEYIQQYRVDPKTKNPKMKPLIPADRQNCKRGFLDNLK